MEENILDRKVNDVPLGSWKEIAVYLQRDVKTVQRWENKEGLPVRRHRHQARSSVYAYPSELEAWRTNRAPERAAAPIWKRLPWRSVPAFASMTALALAVMMAGSGPHVGALVQAADGIVIRQVWTGPGANSVFNHGVSPDGRYVGFTATGDTFGELAVRDLTTGETRLLTHNNVGRERPREAASYSVFSPDGKQVAFWWEKEQGNSELHVVGMDGSQPRVLYARARYDLRPVDWSSDGKLILADLFHMQGDGGNRWTQQIVAVNAADGSLTTLKTFEGAGPGLGGMRWSPNGRFVAYDFPAGQERNRDVFVLSVTDGLVTVPVEHPAQDQLLGWAPDGESILFLSDRTGNEAAWAVRVADGKPLSEATLVKRDMGAIRPMGFTRNGSFYYAVRDLGYNVYTATLNGGPPSLLVKRRLGANSEPAWSPDGKSIAYVRTPPSEGPSILCVRSMETGQEREYAPDLRFSSPQWSPDGGSILLRGRDSQGQRLSSKLDLKTGRISPVLVNRWGSWIVTPRWSADGGAVYYIEPWDEEAKRPARLMRRDLATGRDEEVRVLPEGVTTGQVLPSPDNRWLALSLNRDLQRSLAVVPTDGAELRELPGPSTGGFGPPMWAPDSQQILFFRQLGTRGRGSRSELWGVSVEGGEQRSLGYSVPMGAESPSLHPDGKQLAFQMRGPVTEIWAMENFLREMRGKE